MVMQKVISIFEKARRFKSAKGGLAAVEFGLLAPIMVFMFFATIEGSEALSASRRVALSVNTVADLVAQETTIEAAQLNDLFVGMENIISQDPIQVDFNVVSLILDPVTNDIIVHWSRDNNGGEPYPAGQVYTGPAQVTLFDANSSIVVGEVVYDYTPTLTAKLIQNFTFERFSTRWPRRSFRVQFCETPTNCTT